MNFSPNWKQLFPFPTGTQVDAHNRKPTPRSPFIGCWLSLPDTLRYSEFKISFKADHLPRGTYCCMGQWKMDHAPLAARGLQPRTESAAAHGYAGFQHIVDGKKVSIMSFWDVFCRDSTPRERCLRAKRVFPVKDSDNETFGGEGTGVHRSVPYPWQAGRWYQMHLRCIRSAESGNTLVEQWVCDLETGDRTLLCIYDSCIPNSAFCGSMAVFLENYLTEYAGEIRSLQFRDAAYLEESSRRWRSFTSVHITAQGGQPHYEGSYRFGVTDGLVWMITSGVGGDWYTNGKGQKGNWFSL